MRARIATTLVLVIDAPSGEEAAREEIEEFGEKTVYASAFDKGNTLAGNHGLDQCAGA